MPIKGVMFMLGEEEIVLAEENASKIKGGIFLDELAAVAGCRYYFGGNGISRLRQFYSPGAFGDVIYSNIRWQGVLVENPGDLGGTKLQVEERRVRGLIWYLVALSPVLQKGPGQRMCTAMVQGWVFDEHEAARGEKYLGGGSTVKITPLIVPCSKLNEPAPVLWYGVTDKGKRVDWGRPVQELHARHAKAAGEDEEKVRNDGKISKTE